MCAKILCFLSAIVLFSTSFTDASKLKLVPSGTKTIHKDGATHTITKFMIVPENYSENFEYKEIKSNLLKKYKAKEEITSKDKEIHKLYTINENSSKHYDNKQYFGLDMTKQSNNSSNGGFHFLKSYKYKNHAGGAHDTVTNDKNNVKIFQSKTDSIIPKKTVTTYRIYKISPSNSIKSVMTDSANKFENNLGEASVVQQEDLNSYGNVTSLLPFKTIKVISHELRTDLKKDIVRQKASDDQMNILHTIALPETDGKKNINYSISVTEKNATTQIHNTSAPHNDSQLTAVPESHFQNNSKTVGSLENHDNFNLKHIGLPENDNNRRETEQEHIFESADNRDAKKLNNNELYQEMVNGTTTTENTTYVDDTRREENPLKSSPSSEDRFEIASQPTVATDKVKINITDTSERINVQIFDQNSLHERNELEGEGLCDNAEFLIKILTVMLPLLKKEVPEHVRTSYVLKIFRDLLKSSPEGAQDQEVMYKINDLLQTLEKYHVDGLDNNTNALRYSVMEPEQQGLKSKIVLKYEIPHFQNENCTAELLTIIKVVQEAILRLVNNPLCKSKIITTKLPLVTNFDAYFKNPELYSYLPDIYPSKMAPNDFYVSSNNIQPNPGLPSYINENYSNLPNKPESENSHKIVQINFPNSDSITKEEEILPDVPQNTYPYYEDTEKKPGYPNNNLPSQDTHPLYFYTPNSLDKHTIYSNLHDIPTDSPNLYDSSPTFSHMLNGDIDKPRNPLDINTGVEYPVLQETTPKPLFDISLPSDRSLPFDRELDYKRVPSQNHKYPLPLDFYGFDDSSVVKIGNKHKHPTSYYVPENKTFDNVPFEVAGSGGSGYVQFGQKQPRDNLELEEYIPIETNQPSQNIVPPVFIDESSFESLPKPDPNYLPLDFYGTDNSAYIPIGQHSNLASNVRISSSSSPLEVNGIRNSGDVESVLPFEITGTGSGDVHTGPYKKPSYVNFLSNVDNSPNGDHSSNIKYDDVMPRPHNLSPFGFTGDGSGVIDYGQNQPNLDFEFDLPSEKLNPHSIVDIYSPSSSPLPFVVPGDGSGETEINRNQQNSNFKSDLPYKRPKPYSKIPNEPFDVTGDGSGENRISQNQPSTILEFDLPSPSSYPSPFDVVGDNGSAEISIGQSRPNPAFNFDFPLEQPTIPPFQVTGSAESAYIPIGQPLNPFDFYLSSPGKKRPTDVPNKYDSSANSAPMLNDKLDSSSEIPLTNEPHIPFDFFISTPRPYSPFEVRGGESGEIQIRSSPQPVNENLVNFHLPKQLRDKPSFQYDYYLSPNVPNPLINGNLDSSQGKFIPDEKDFNEFDAPSHMQSHMLNSLYPMTSENEHPEHTITNKYYLPGEDRFETNHLPSNNKYLAKKVIISEPVTSRSPDLQIVNQYVIPNENNLPYEKVLPDDSDISKSILWSNESPYSSKQAYPDKKILIIIKDNIGIIEQKIPKTHLSAAMLEHIKKIKELIYLEQITVEEYVDIINRYQILIELIKHLNISNEILKELLISLTNEGKLESQAGKSNVIELTYLIKRPTPLIYQPYYYIKYRLPYVSFLTRMEKILATKPHLSKYPAKLYKELIPISKVAETSPDLEGYGKDEIQKITFNDGTLAGAKMIKRKRLDMNNTLNALKAINTDFTVDDIYQIIKNLDDQLKKSPGHGLVIEQNSTPAINDYNQFDKILVKLKKQPKLTEKMTKITTKNVLSDQVIENAHQTMERGNVSSNGDSIKLNDELVTRSQDNHVRQLNDLVGPIKTNPSVDYNSIDNKIKADGIYHHKSSKDFGKNDVAYDYLPSYSELSEESFFNYSDKKNVGTDEPDDMKLKNDVKIDWNQFNSAPIQNDKVPSSSLGSKLLDATINAYGKEVNSHNSKQINFEPVSFEPSKSSTDYFADDSNIINYNWKPPVKHDVYPSVGSKLLDATIKAHHYKQENDPTSQQFYFDSEPSASSNYIVGQPKTVQSQLVQHSKTYINGIPIQHSKTYAVDNPFNQVNQFQTYNIDKPNDFEKQSQYYPNNLDLNFGNYNLAKNSGSFRIPNQNVYKNNILNPYQYHYVHQRMPFAYKQYRTPWSRYILG